MSQPLSLLNLFMTVCLAIGGIAAYRQGFARTVGEVQERVIAALKQEIEALQGRVNALEQENTRLNQTLTTICSALKQRGIHITIDGDVVSIYDCTGEGSAYNTRIQNIDPLTQSGTHSPRTHSTAQRRQNKRRETQVEEEQR